MFILFKIFCDYETQVRLHKVLRRKVREWQDSDLVERSVLTYHYKNHPYSLYACLDITEVNENATDWEQIPSRIKDVFDNIIGENNVTLDKHNYRLWLEEREASKYYAASVEEILRFASSGTKIALEVFEPLEMDKNTWKDDVELSNFIYSRIKDELGESYEWTRHAPHFVFNPLDVPDEYLSQDSVKSGTRALNRIKKYL